MALPSTLEQKRAMWIRSMPQTRQGDMASWICNLFLFYHLSVCLFIFLFIHLFVHLSEGACESQRFMWNANVNFSPLHLLRQDLSPMGLWVSTCHQIRLIMPLHLFLWSFLWMSIRGISALSLSDCHLCGCAVGCLSLKEGEKYCLISFCLYVLLKVAMFDELLQ